MTAVPATRQVADLFRKAPVMDMPAIERALGGRSRRSVFRDLEALGYVSSYTHTGRYSTLASVPDFDPDGLWRYQGIGFSRDSTLKATVRRLAESAEAGRTQRELQLRLEVRVHNPLLDLVEHKQLRRESIAAEYVYVAAARRQATKQLEHRRALVAAGLGASVPVAPTLEIEVLVEVIHGARLPPRDAATVAARLSARGIRASEADVRTVLERHGLKKTAPSRSRPSRR
ncbi:MAG: hypothetical protein HYR50_00300 [Candidatus Rokubacteria bacterium]|nr:hypothetical protein [Candidatus Rokubacteria bacterium]